jgi:hypothetical protein
MRYIIRANAAPSAKGKPQEPPSYWVPQHDGTYTRTGEMNQALARSFTTRADAVAFMEANGVPEGAATEVIEVGMA